MKITTNENILVLKVKPD